MEENVILRKMEELDVTEVARIEKENFSMPWSLDAFLDAIHREETVYLVAVKEQQVVGYIGAWCAADEAEITQIAVDVPFRRQGIGEKLLVALEETCREIMINAYFLEVRESNEAARKLYSRCGFSELGIRKNFYEKPVENAVVMRK